MVVNILVTCPVSMREKCLNMLDNVTNLEVHIFTIFHLDVTQNLTEYIALGVARFLIVSTTTAQIRALCFACGLASSSTAG